MTESLQQASVSVIIPCYNCSETISRAINSVFEQTLRPQEVLLIDDASEDNTLEILHDLQHKFDQHWIKILQLETNSGPSHARNYGWEHAKTDYVAFLDADDSWHPQKIELQYKWMIKNPSIVLTGHKIALSNTDKEKPVYTAIEHAVQPINKTLFLFKNLFSTPTIMVKNKISQRFDEHQRFAEDYLLWLNILFTYKRVFYINHELAFIHKAPYGASGLSNQLWQMEKGELQTYKKLRNDNYIGLIRYSILISFSVLKYVKRVITTQIKI